MKITFVLPGYPWKPAGGFRTVYEYANHLVTREHTVTIVYARQLSNWSPPNPPNFYRWLRREAGHVRNLFFTPKVDWQPMDHRIKTLYVPEPIAQFIPDADAVIATFWPTAEEVLKYPDSKGCKFYLVQDFYPYLGTQSQIEDSWRLPLKKMTISHWLYQLALKSGVSKTDVTAIPIGVEHKRFRLLNDVVTRPKRIAMMYSINSYKAPFDGIKALEIVKNKFDDIQAICFGVNPRPRTLPHWIEYVSKVSDDELVNLYNSSRIFISSSIAEGFALPPAEAMACGCAVVATDSGGIREYAEHGTNILLSPPRNPEALADNLLRVLDNDNLRIQLAEAGSKKIQEFTWKQSTDLLEQFLLKHVRV